MAFDIDDARAILEPWCKKHSATTEYEYKYFEINECGVWPKVKYDKAMKAETVMLSWRPARVFKGEPGAPKVDDTPMLPFPFSASELAAFMLNGAGECVLDFYGYWSDGPDPERIDEIGPDSCASTALIQAYAVYHDAKKTVGAYPRALEAEADRARKAYNVANNEANKREGVFAAMPGIEEAVARLERNVRRARAVASIAALDCEMKATATAAKTKSEAWLKAMVRQLLLPAPVLAPATPGAVAKETTKQRRARWLDWSGEGERGAVQRVYERELLINPKADRSNIGKEIKKALEEKDADKRGGDWTAQLVRSGKRGN
jgi:hypothetical protein